MTLVFVENLQRGMVVAQDVFPPEGSITPLVTKHVTLTGMMIESLEKRGIRSVYIDEKETHRRREAAQAAMRRQPVIPKPKPVITRELRDNAIDSLQTAFEAFTIGAADVHTSSQIIKHLDTVVDQLVDSLLRDKGALVNVTDLKSYDEYTYHHSLSVAVLSIAIGQHLNFDRTELHRLGMTAMMHDIGKTAVPIEVIHKTSRLSDEEFQVVKNHSPAGYDYLMKTTLGDEEIRWAVLGHHEKFDGSGYPNGLKGDEIPVWSRIISVADVYDALTSNRPYRQPMQPCEAIEYIMGGTGKDFDYDMVQAFVKKVELYPVGSQVQLSDGRIGTVLNNESQVRPVVRLIDTGEILDLYRDRSLLNVVVNRLLPDPVILSK